MGTHPISKRWRWAISTSLVALIIWQWSHIKQVPPPPIEADYEKFEAFITEDYIQVRNAGARTLVGVNIEFVAECEFGSNRGEYRGKRWFAEWKPGEIQILRVFSPTGGSSMLLSVRFTGKATSEDSQKHYKLQFKHTLAANGPG